MSISQQPIRYSADCESVPFDEVAQIRQVLEAIQNRLGRSQDKPGVSSGHIHAKTHGYAQGELRILPNLPQELAQGLFQSEQTYPALVRFSNSANREQADALPDGRGLSLKIQGISGQQLENAENVLQTQDFLLINHPVFFAGNVQDLLRLERILLESNDQILTAATAALTGSTWNPFNWHWQEIVTLTQNVSHWPTHPANITYFSMTPIRYGDYVVKYRVRPARPLTESYLNTLYELSTQADAMRLALQHTLTQRELLFEFQVQLRNNEHSMPIEDARVEWPETESPFRTVAHLLLPRQEIEPLRHQVEFQNLAFNPWHGLASHRPLGGINRLRRCVYPVVAAHRQVPLLTTGELA